MRQKVVKFRGSLRQSRLYMNNFTPVTLTVESKFRFQNLCLGFENVQFILIPCTCIDSYCYKSIVQTFVGMIVTSFGAV